MTTTTGTETTGLSIPEPLQTQAGRPATSSILRMILRASSADRSTWRLPVVAFSVITTIILDVTGGAVMMWHIPGTNADFYRLTSSIAVILLVLPLMTLASSAARLSARRRDDRLSSLRLIGASSHLLRVVTLAEAGLQALVGSVLGIVGYLICVPLLGRLSFNGSRIGARSVLLGPAPVAGVIVALVLLALISSAIGLRRVDVSPLGVRMRSQPRSVSWIRLAIGAAMVALLVSSKTVLEFLARQTGTVGVYVFLAVLLAVVVELANIIGPKLLSLYFKHRLKTAKTATDVVAARQVLENPRSAWTQVASLGAVCVVGMLAGTCAAIMQAASKSGSDDPTARIIGQDLQTGVILLIVFAFATVACSVGVNQASAILDRRPVEVGLDIVGMNLTAQDKVRRITVISPMRFAMVTGLVATGLLLIPLVGIALVTKPVTILVTVGTILVGSGMVRLSLWATRPTLNRVLADGLARTE
ncbi:ABC transporter permease [Cutibacterium equinum]|uniref:ABC transporter permease n=1 Tax=Cutibacterium equinum TaxID=3016342 RepID=A0ABY7QYB6_9ACTN|nr:FtsX-like permease family protein [Cutibacterium equinum]WCC80036.1 ABC transporter permease [Cutibacterium equinum]